MARKSRAWQWIVFVFCLAVVCFVLRRAGDVPGVRRAPSGCPLEAIVKHVIDGDSFVAAEGYEIRLLNIDTPEYGEPLSKQAGARLEKLILGRKVSLSYDQEKKDRYGRLLCHVHVVGVWVNRLLVEEGLATVFLVRPNLTKRAELTAQAARRMVAAPSRARKPLCLFAQWFPLPPPGV